MMLDDLRSRWREEMMQPPRLSDAAIRSITNDVARIDRAVRFRDFWFIAGFAAAGALGIFFVLLNSAYFEWPVIVGFVWFLITAVIAIAALLWARAPRRSCDWTLRARFENEIAALGRQKWLLDNVNYWLLAPIGIGVLITVLSRDAARPVPWAYVGLSALVLASTHWLCRRESARKLAPLLDRLRNLHRDLTAD